MTLQPKPKKKRYYLRRKKPSEVLRLCIHCNGQNCIKRGKASSSGKQVYWCKDCERAFVEPEAPKVYEIAPKDEYQKDIWDCRRLGISPSIGNQSYTLNFKKITQDWLLQATKEYIKFILSTLSFSSAANKLVALKRFSVFLSDRYPSIKPAQIDRSLIIDFLAYLARQDLAIPSRRHIIGDVRDFLDSCHQNDWLPVARYLVRREDYPKGTKSIPRYIPEIVMQQLNACIDDLPEPVMRMTLILIECGMRISELRHLKKDCLLQDKAGDWFLRYYQFKMKKEITIPISREIVRVIQEQRRYTEENFNASYEYLFGSTHYGAGFRPKAKPISRDCYSRYLNKLAKKHNICDESGKLWRFQTHQFRHTVGTRMINNGVPQHIIQRYLGHESPEMTATYAHIHDQTLKEEVAKFRGKVVNISGQVVEEKTPEVETKDLQWFKKTMQAQALPNGSCALPTISQGCPHANACLTCTHFRTTPEYLEDHKKQLRQTKQIIEKAEANGWLRQVEMNKKVKANLEAMIATLEAKGDGES